MASRASEVYQMLRRKAHHHSGLRGATLRRIQYPGYVLSPLFFHES